MIVIIALVIGYFMGKWKNIFIDHCFIFGSFNGGVWGNVYQNSSFFSLFYSLLIEFTLIDLFEYETLNASSVEFVLLKSLLLPITLFKVN